jgi:WD40 repeat protein/serine/threonine protein kinase
VLREGAGDTNDERTRPLSTDHVRRASETEALPPAAATDPRPASSPPSVRPLLAAGVMVDHFEIMRQLGRGGMGEVYLARDTKLGRKVALKLVRTSELSSDEARARFLLEARATACFSHPNIVAIHSVGEHDGTPYVALEYLEGENLRDRLNEGTPSTAEVMRIGVAIAEALAEAHRHGVVHGDLKPPNVVIGGDGRVRVVDFGLARFVQPLARPGLGLEDTAADGAAHSVGAFAVAPSGALGTPAYMAPEQWREHPAVAATDVWALGCILFELCAGARPIEADDLIDLGLRVVSPEPAPRLDAVADVPPALADLVAGCLAKDPADRPEAAQVAQQLGELLDATRRSLSGLEGPFRGLLAFTEEHGNVYFGREAEVLAFVEQLRVTPTAMVVGPSGAGKSSFVHAGVVPRLREQGRWSVLSLRPGPRPLHALALLLARCQREVEPTGEEDTAPARAFGEAPLSGLGREDPTSAPASTPPSEPAADSLAVVPSHLTPSSELVARELRRTLVEMPRALSLALRALARHRGGRVLLVVDQLEELFTLGADGLTRACFMEAVCSAADHPLDPVRVVVTVRDDFLGRLGTSETVRRALARVTVLQSLAPEALVRVLVEPLGAMGYRFDDPALPDRMVREVAGEQACLPLLQFAAELLWERRDEARKLVRRAAYDEMGGVAGALARHADGVLEGLPPRELRVARELLTRLVTAERTRRVVPRAEILAGLDESDAEAMLARLTQARLVTVTRHRGADVEDGREGADLELAHESLIAVWGTLAEWLDSSHEERAFIEEVDRAAQLWQRHGERPEQLWGGAVLLEALHRLERCTEAAPERVYAFLDASAERERLGRRRKRLAVAGAMMLLGLGIAVLAVQKHEASVQRERAEQREAEMGVRRAEALREGARAALREGRDVEARAKVRMALEAHDAPSARALWWQLGRQPTAWVQQTGATLYRARFTSGGDIAVASKDHGVYLFDRHTAAVRALRGHEDQVLALDVSRDGKWLATGSARGDLVLWDRGAGAARTVRRIGNGTTATCFSPDGTLLATGGVDGTVQLWELDGAGGAQAPRSLPSHASPVRSLAFARGGEVLLSASMDGLVRSSNVASGSERRHWRLAGLGLHGLDAHPTRALFATGAGTGIQLRDLETGEVERELRGHSAELVAVRFRRDGSLLASTARDRHVIVWNVESGAEIGRLVGHEDPALAVDFAPDDESLVSAGFDKTLRLWRLETLRRTEREHEHESTAGTGAPALALSVHPSGTLVASAGYDGLVHLWDAKAGSVVRVAKSGRSLRAVAFSPDGSKVAAHGVDGVTRIWETASARELRVLRSQQGQGNAVAFLREGSILVAGGTDHHLSVWDVTTGALSDSVPVPSAILMIAPLADGERFFTGGMDGVIRLWRLGGHEPIGELRGHTAPVHTAVLMRDNVDGLELLSGGFDQTVRRWRLAEGREENRVVATVPTRILALARLADGGFAVGEAGHTVRLFDAGGAERALLGAHHGEVNALGLSPDGSLLASASDDHSVRLWDLARGRPAWHAVALLPEPPRLLTHVGWIDLRTGAALEPAGAPAWRRALEARGRRALGGQGSLCVLGHDGALERWDLGSDRVVASTSGAGELHAGGRAGCAYAGADGAAFVVSAGPPTPLGLEGHVRAMAADAGGRLAVATDRALVVLDAARATVLRRESPAFLSAIGLSEGTLAIGYRDGNLDVVRLATEGAPAPPPLERLSTSAVTRVIGGPMGTLIAGFADGTVGLWDTTTGVPLARTALHGSVTDLLLEDGALYAATDLGAHLRWSLASLHADYCPLLREIWAKVPVVWEAERAAHRAPPADHGCALGGR